MYAKYLCLFAIFFLTSCVSILYVEKALPENGIIKIKEAVNKNLIIDCHLTLLESPRIKVISAGPLFLPLIPTPWLWISYRQYQANFQTRKDNPYTRIELSCEKNLYCSGAQISIDGESISTKNRFVQRQSNSCEFEVDTKNFLNSKFTISGVKIEKNGIEYSLEDVKFESKKILQFKTESILNVAIRYTLAHSN